MLSTPAIKEAYEFACQAHAGQMYGDQTYDVHFLSVAQTLVEHGYDTDDWIIMGLTHDVVEDTPVTKGQLADRYGDNVAEGVWTVSGFGATRAIRNGCIALKLLRRPQYAPLKCADRIRNVRSAAEKKSIRHAELYLGEAGEFDPLVKGHVLASMFRDLQDAYHEAELMLQAEGVQRKTGPAMEVHPDAAFDDQAIDAFAEALKVKMAQSRAKGRGGWSRPEEVSQAALVEALHHHVSKGDPRDVALFAMMLNYHGWSTAMTLSEAA
ncbi:metal-dependent phosphohydrolase [Caulobacter phage CcrBL9]|uniref:HD/PDEase-like domain protein n=1 Tax=Caulobacter phage CcrBL9 TaxID=2283270 RepID=A0A385EET4_9CAUD|nr:metal-dependent phosphohydrolase [Caulobacter phage CcrBL9]AXQ69317.1 HD/PDEase-like domain protein [Caulobacter phage CcrBL9]